MNVDGTVIASIAARLREAQATGVPIPPVRDALAPGGLDAAYAVQDTNTRHALAAGQKLVGRKIGLTSKAVQVQIGVDSPDFGMLFDGMRIPHGGDIARGRAMQPKVEAEIAFVLERDLDGGDLSFGAVASSVAYAVPAIEVVASRIENWNIRLLDTVADNASSGLFVLGEVPRKLDGLDLTGCGMTMTRRGEIVSTGRGDACLGHPLEAALWLARTMVRVGRPLRAGDIIMSGALGPMVAVAPGDRFEARIEGLGGVAVAFAT
ncbi:MAG: fumarylacetoacetate hydrolase family protein [Burkholderiales bacterium]